MSLLKGVGLFPSLRYNTIVPPWSKYSGNPVLDIGGGGSWFDTHVSHPCVIKDGATYILYHAGHNGTKWFGIGRWTSTDGITWSNGNLCLPTGGGGQWDENVYGGWVVREDASTWKMWYTGYFGTEYSIGLATSSNGSTWTKYGSNPVLIEGSGGSWDDDRVIQSKVIKDGSTYKMWYQGRGSTYQIGYATSGDGTTWTKYGSNPVLDLGTVGQWDDTIIGAGPVIKVGSLYRIWYSGRGNGETINQLGYATSVDGVTWVKSLNNPVLLYGENTEWDDNGASTACVIKDGDIYKMWYTGMDGTNNRIGYATAP